MDWKSITVFTVLVYIRFDTQLAASIFYSGWVFIREFFETMLNDINGSPIAGLVEEGIRLAVRGHVVSTTFTVKITTTCVMLNGMEMVNRTNIE
jgi:hypothetical protein